VKGSPPSPGSPGVLGDERLNFPADRSASSRRGGRASAPPLARRRADGDTTVAMATRPCSTRRKEFLKSCNHFEVIMKISYYRRLFQQSLNSRKTFYESFLGLRIARSK
jgi:hypothetical protein